MYFKAMFDRYIYWGPEKRLRQREEGERDNVAISDATKPDDVEGASGCLWICTYTYGHMVVCSQPAAAVARSTMEGRAR